MMMMMMMMMIIIINLLTVKIPCDRGKLPYFISEKTLHTSNPG